jgi:hypothetical protein
MFVKMTREELKAIEQKFYDGKRKVRNNKLAYVCKLERKVNKLRPRHISKESWETLTYTTRLQLIEDDELKQLRAQQWELYRKLRDEATASS